MRIELNTQAVSAPAWNAGPLWYDLPGTFYGPEDAAPAAPADPGGAASPAAQSTTPAQVDPTTTTVAPSSGGTPADEFADVEHPGFKQRLSEVARKRDEFKTQLESIRPYEEWAPAIARLAELGLTPQQIADHQFQQAQDAAQPAGLQTTQPDTEVPPSARFAAFLAKGIGRAPTQDWWDGLTDAEQFSLEQSWQLQEWREGQMAERQASDDRTRAAELQNQLQAVQTDHPVLKDEALTAVLQMAQKNSRDTRIVAGQLVAMLDRYKAQVISEYANSKDQDGAIPPAAGGTSPAPTAAFDVVKASKEDREKALEAAIRGVNTAS